MIRYVTRWALSTGIRKVAGKYDDRGEYFMGPDHLFVKASEAFETVEEAQARAREMAKKKAVSLRKTLAKFEDPKWAADVIEG